MGDTKKRKRLFDTPKKRWDKGRIEKERGIKNRFGLKNKRELWKTETFLRKKKDDARKLLAMELEEREKREKELVDSLAKYGLVGEKAGIDDVLSISTESILERRLETLVWRHGLAGTIKQARQFITHGHIAIKGKKVTVPGYLVKKDEEDKLGYYGKAPIIQEKKKKEIKKIPDGKDKLKKDFDAAKPEGAEEIAEESEAIEEKTAEAGEDIEAEEEEAMEEEIKEEKEEGGPEEEEKNPDDSEADVEEPDEKGEED
ncbi:MAG: 30S ribosomal protein S4 [Candidatus ainarchaeum sp.]|nr:30S ribosomal protein S4 [Candidatus ainarchaeum sp.]